MAESVFEAGLNIVPQFNRNDVSRELTKLKKQLDAENHKLTEALKVGIRIDTSSFLKVTSEYAKVINDISRALEQENNKGFKGKNMKLFSILEQAKDARVEVGKVFSDYEKALKKTSATSSNIVDISAKTGKVTNVLALPEDNYKQVSDKIKLIKNEIKELSTLKAEVNLSDKQINQVDKALINAEKKLDKLKGSMASLSKTKLLNFEPQSAKAATLAMNELKSRMQQLNLATKTGQRDYANMESKIRDLSLSKVRLSKDTNSVTDALRTNSSAVKNNNRLMGEMRTLALQYVGVYAIRNTLKNIIDITAEFEMQKVALAAIIQDQTKANQLFEEAKTQALESPFQVKDVVTYMKQLSAFQIGKNEIAETTKRLADISAGLGVGMDRIILAFGQVRAASVLRGQELRQFTEAGIPLVERLAQKFTQLNGEVVKTSDVFELISERKVPFEMVRDVLWEMTDAGGMFFDMQKKQAETLKGEISNFRDEVQVAFDEIGRGDLDLLKGTIRASRELVAFTSKNIDLITKIGGAVLAAKAASLLFNSTISEQSNILLRNIKLQEKRIAQEIAVNRLADKSLVKGTFSRNTQLNTSQVEQLYVTKQLTEAEIARLFVMNKLDGQAAKFAVDNQLLNTELYKQITTLRLATKSSDIYIASTNRMKLGMFQLRLAFVKTTVALRAFTMALLSNPMTWIVAAVSVVTTLIGKFKQAKQEAEELKKKTIEGVNYTLDELRKNIDDMPESLLIIKAKLDTSGTKEDYAKLNKYLLERYKNDEKLYDMALRRIKALKTEEEIYKSLLQARLDYEQALQDIKDRDVIGFEGKGGWFNDEASKDFEKTYNDGLKMIELVNDLAASQNKQAITLQGIINNMRRDGKSMLDIISKISNYELFKNGETISSLANARRLDAMMINGEMETRYTGKSGILILSEYEKTARKIGLSTRRNLQESNEEYKAIINELKTKIKTVNVDGKTFKIDWNKSDFGVPKEYLQRVSDQLGLAIETVIKNEEWTEQAKDVITGFLTRNKWVLNITPVIGEPEDISIPSIAEFNKALDRAGIRMNIKEEKDRLGWGMLDIKSFVEKQWKESVEVLETIKKSAEKGNKEWEKKLNDAIANEELLLKVAGLAGVDTAKKGDKGKSIYEIEADRIKRLLDDIKDLKDKQEEYAKIKDKSEAISLATAMFTDEQGKFTLPQGFLKGYSDEMFYQFTKEQNDLLKKLRTQAKKQSDKDKLTTIIDNINAEVRNVTLKNDQEVINKLLESTSKAFEKSKEKLNIFEDVFKATGDKGLAESLADSIVGVDVSTDMFNVLKQQIFKGINSVYKDSAYKSKMGGMIIDLSKASLFPDLEKIVENMPDDLKKAFTDMINNAKNTSNQILLDAIKGVQKYKSIEERKAIIAIDTAKKIDKVRESGADKAKKDMAIQALLNAQTAEENKLALEQFKESFWYTDIFNNIDEVSHNTLRLMKERLVSLVAMIKDTAEASEIKMLVEKIDAIDKTLKPEPIDWRAIFTNNIEAIDETEYRLINSQKVLDELNSEYEEAKKARQELLKPDNATQEQTIAYDTKVAELEAKLLDLTKKLEVATKTNTQAQKENNEANDTHVKNITLLTNKLSKQTQALSELSSIMSSTSSIVQSLMKSFGSGESEEFNKVMEAMNETISVAQAGFAIVNSLLKLKNALEIDGAITTAALNAAMAANPAFMVAMAIMALVGALKLYQYFADKSANGEIEEMNEAIERSDEIIQQLENSLARLAGSDYYKAVSAQIDEMEKQAKASQRQLDKEKSKTKGGDEDKIQEYSDNVTQYQQAIIDKQRELVEELAGGDLKSVTEDIINTFLDAYKAGEDTFNAIKKSFADMIQNMITKTIAAKVISKYLQGVFDEIENMVESGNYSDNSMQEIAQSILDASNKANQAMNQFMPLYNSIGSMFGSSLSTANQLANGIAGASEQSISTLAGYWLSHLNVTNVMAEKIASIELMMRERFYGSMAAPDFSNPSLATNDAVSQQYLQTMLSIEANTRLSAEKVSQFYDRFNQVVVVNPNGDTAFGIKIIE